MFLQTLTTQFPVTARIVSIATMVVSGASMLHTLLPPWDWKPAFVEEGLCDFPQLQRLFYSLFHNRYYKLFVYIVGYVALNARSTFWKSISVNNPSGVNANAAANQSK